MIQEVGDVMSEGIDWGEDGPGVGARVLVSNPTVVLFRTKKGKARRGHILAEKDRNGKVSLLIREIRHGRMFIRYPNQVRVVA